MPFFVFEHSSALRGGSTFKQPLGMTEEAEPTPREFRAQLVCSPPAQRLERGDVEELEKLVLKGKVKLIAAGVTLSRGSSDELAVDSRGTVHFGDHDVQSPLLQDGRGNSNIRSAAGHVCRDGHRRGLAGLLDDRRFELMMSTIEDLVIDSDSFERCRQAF